MRQRTSPLASIVLGSLLAGAASCQEKPVAKPDPAPLAASQSAPPPVTSASAAPPAAGVITLIAEKFQVDGVSPGALYPVEGALLVGEGQRVGRVAGDKIEWIGKIPPETPGYGAQNVLTGAYGRWPDSIGVVYTTGNGRAPQPTYMPLIGKGPSHTFAAGGAMGGFLGYLVVGDSALIAGWDMGVGLELVTVRGRPLSRPQISAKLAGCTEEELKPMSIRPEEGALRVSAVESSPAGTILAIGKLCGDRSVAASIWDKAGKPRIMDLSRFWDKKSPWPVIVKGSDDNLYAAASAWLPVLRYHDGEIEALPLLGSPLRGIFTSREGALYANDGEALHRFEGGRWIRALELPPKNDLRTFVFDGEARWGMSYATVYRLKAGPPAAPAGECKAPFVYLYEVSYKNDSKFTYPTTQKALASFPDVDKLGLVEFEERYARHLGITAPTMAVAQAAAAHVKATMKDEDPRVFCYAPSKPRVIEMKPVAK